MNGTRALKPFARRAGVLIGAALVVNLVLLLLGSLAGASMTVQPSTVVGVVAVAVATVLTLAVGFAVAAALLARAPRFVRALQVAGGVVAVLSVASPLLADTDTATKLVLGAMHLVCGAAFVVGLQPYTSRVPAVGGRLSARP